MLNLSFAFLALGFVGRSSTNAVSEVGLVSALSFGIAYSIGIVNTYYLAGFMIKKIPKRPIFTGPAFTFITVCYLIYYVRGFLRTDPDGGIIYIDGPLFPYILSSCFSSCLLSLLRCCIQENGSTTATAGISASARDWRQD